MTDFDAHAQPVEQRLAAVGADGFVTADEVLFLRRTVFADGVVSARELDAIFGLGNRAPDGDPEWAQFFAEVVADFYLREEEPHGYLTEDEFDDVRERIAEGGGANALERTLLVKLMETARETPPAFSAYTGRALKAAVLEKDTPGVATEDLALLRRWLFAAGGDGHVAVTRAEAEILFEINDALRAGESTPAWTELFTQGVVNHLMACLGYSPSSRAEAMRRHEFISDHSVNVGGFFARMVSGVSGLFGGGEEKSVYEQKADTREAAVAHAEQITPEESTWLASRIGRDGALDENERALIERMKALDADLPEELKALVDRAA